MVDGGEAGRNGTAAPKCDCGYVCRGETVEDRVRDGQRHALDVHGIDVSPAQVLINDVPEAAAEGGPG